MVTSCAALSSANTANPSCSWGAWSLEAAAQGLASIVLDSRCRHDALTVDGALALLPAVSASGRVERNDSPVVLLLSLTINTHYSLLYVYVPGTWGIRGGNTQPIGERREICSLIAPHLQM